MRRTGMDVVELVRKIMAAELAIEKVRAEVKEYEEKRDRLVRKVSNMKLERTPDLTELKSLLGDKTVVLDGKWVVLVAENRLVILDILTTDPG